jgi:hypothetical protein
MLGGADGPAATSGAQDADEVAAACAGLVEIIDGLEDGRLLAFRRCCRPGFGDRRGPWMVMAGNTAGFAAVMAPAGKRLAAPGAACVWAEASCWSDGASTATKASLRRFPDITRPQAASKERTHEARKSADGRQSHDRGLGISRIVHLSNRPAVLPGKYDVHS